MSAHCSPAFHQQQLCFYHTGLLQFCIGTHVLPFTIRIYEVEIELEEKKEKPSNWRNSSTVIMKTLPCYPQKRWNIRKSQTARKNRASSLKVGFKYTTGSAFAATGSAREWRFQINIKNYHKHWSLSVSCLIWQNIMQMFIIMQRLVRGSIRTFHSES